MSFSYPAYSFAEGCKPSAAIKDGSPFIFRLSSKTSTTRRARRAGRQQEAHLLAPLSLKE